MRVSVVIPTFNERDNIPLVIKGVHGALASKGNGFEVIVVDDDSPDGTWRAVEAIAAETPNVKLIRRVGERGLARAVVRGFEAARGEILAVMDGDLQHPPERLAGLISALEAGDADVAVASRHVEGGGVSDWSLIRRSVSWTATLAATWILPGTLATVRDPMSGFFAIRRSVIEGVRLEPEGYKILLEVLVRGRYDRLVEIPYTFIERQHGGSKLGPRQYGEFIGHLTRLSWASGELGRLLRFSAVGASGVVVNMGLLAILTASGAPLLIAGIAAIEAAMISNFVLNETWSFADLSRRRPKLTDRLRRFFMFNLLCTGGALINLGLLWSLSTLAGFHYLLSNLIGIGAGLVWNYGLNANVTWESARTQHVLGTAVPEYADPKTFSK